MGGLVVDEALFATTPLIGESRVVQAKEVQQGGYYAALLHASEGTGETESHG